MMTRSIGTAFSMSSLTSVIASSWSGVSTYGKASSSSRCHGVSGAEGVPGRGHPGAVELDEAGGDVLDGLAGAALALGPVGAAEAVERRRLAADVLGDELELVGRDEDPVAGLALLARRELEDEVLAGRALHRALHHLDVARDAVLLVHDRVAGAQLHRVDGVLAPARHPLADVLGPRPAGAGQVALGQQDRLEQVAAEAGLEAAGRQVDDAGVGAALVDPGRDLGVLEQLVQALRRGRGPRS